MLKFLEEMTRLPEQNRSLRNATPQRNRSLQKLIHQGIQPVQE